MEPQYEILVLGAFTNNDLKHLDKELINQLQHFDLSLGKEVRLLTSENLLHRRIEAATCVAYFGGEISRDNAEIQKLRNNLVPIIPVLKHGQGIRENLPTKICDLNAYTLPSTPNYISLVTLILENIGLLRHQRRVFISYRRQEAKEVAIQLHDEFAHRGFDVFLDTHSIRAGQVFQEVLWNRLCDSDVLVMLDTDTYFESRWTTEELGKARAKEIKVLRVIWPARNENSQLKFAEDIFLTNKDFDTPTSLTDEVLDRISVQLEDVRSRSIAARAISISGKFKAEMLKIGAEVIGVGIYRSLLVKLEGGSFITAYPVVGVPTAQSLNEVESWYALQSIHTSTPFLIYDHVGIGKKWEEHLSWLDKYVSRVELVDVSKAAWLVVERSSA